ncbi:MAG: hypothetical protein JXA92_12710 [candidate division Zixibacteria bacterium]|nr:hypothetical protein [candidate division Zixibacteria bacterium]
MAEALRNGEIDSVRYFLLLEIIENGIDSTNRYLLDEVPNLFYVRTSQESFTPALEGRQTEPFESLSSRRAERTGYLDHKFYCNLEERTATAYSSTLDVNLNRHWRINLRTRRDKSGCERITGRSVVWSSKKGILRQLAFGSFNERWGLGTVFGYHGKILTFSEKLGTESFLYPDYGGYNGLCGIVELASWEGRGLVSFNRDVSHSLLSMGTMLAWRPSKNITAGGIWGFNRLENRPLDSGLNDIKLGIYLKGAYAGGYSSVEISDQLGENSNAFALVTEGRHHFGKAEIKYAGWRYDDNFLDFTAGSKAAYLINYLEFPMVAYDLANKRAGQKGLLIKTVVRPFLNCEFYNSLLLAARNRDTVNTEYLVGLSGRITSKFELSGDYLTRLKERTVSSDRADSERRRFRIESRFVFNSLSARMFIAYNIDKEQSDGVSFFAGLKYRSAGLENLEIWSNMERIENGRIQYWYIYIKTTQRVLDNVSVSVKLGNAFRRGSDIENQSALTAELKAVI